MHWLKRCTLVLFIAQSIMSKSMRTHRSFLSVVTALSLLNIINITQPINANNGKYLPVNNTPTKTTASVPHGFEDTLIASIPSPTDLAFTPDGRMLVTSQPG